MSIALGVKNLSFSYERNKRVLNGLSLSVEQGKITVLLGKNGCGKSTLIDCIIGYKDFESGEIILFDKSIKSLSVWERAKCMAYISQDTTINMDFTVKEFILFGRSCHLKLGTTLKNEDYSMAEEYAEKCGVSHLLKKDVNKISGGERQLVFFARALTQQTPLIVMDEPTSALDVENQYEILSLMKTMEKEEGKTIILSSHNPNHALFLDSDVCLMKNGAIVKTGYAKDVVTVENLKPIYGENICNSNDLSYKEISFKNRD